MQMVISPIDKNHVALIRDRLPIAFWCDLHRRMRPCEGDGADPLYYCDVCEAWLHIRLTPNLPFEDGYPPLPVKEETLFVSKPATTLAPILGGTDSFHYEDGYLSAALLLIDSLDRRECMDHLVYPIVFVSRHYLELVLKSLVGRCNLLIKPNLDEKKREELNNTLNQHRLVDLWRLLRPMIPEIYARLEETVPDNSLLDVISDYISEISRTDPSSMNYRYARKKDWKPSLKPEQRSIDLDHFGEYIKRLFGYFHWLDLATRQYEDLLYLSEMERYEEI